MQGPTYTNLWRIERRIYRIYDVNLPYAISIRQLGILTLTICIWVPPMLLLAIPIATWWGAAIWIGPPALLTYLSNRPIIENKTLAELLVSEFRHQTTPRAVRRFNPAPKASAQTEIRSVIWTKPEPDTHHTHTTEGDTVTAAPHRPARSRTPRRRSSHAPA